MLRWNKNSWFWIVFLRILLVYFVLGYSRYDKLIEVKDWFKIIFVKRWVVLLEVFIRGVYCIINIFFCLKVFFLMKLLCIVGKFNIYFSVYLSEFKWVERYIYSLFNIID